MQVLKQILSDQNDKTQLRLLYANQTEGDILVRKEMEELAAEKPDRYGCFPLSFCIPSTQCRGLARFAQYVACALRRSTCMMFSTRCQLPQVTDSS